MSERQAKKSRKVQPEMKAAPKKKSFSAFGAILTAVVVVFVALGTFAVVRQYKLDHPYVPSKVSEFAEEMGITTEEFLTKYGLDTNEEINGDTNINTAIGEMTVAKFAEYSETTVDVLFQQYAFSSDVTEETKWADAQMYVPMSKVLEMSNLDYETFLQNFGLTEEQITPEMLYKDAEPIITEAQNKMIEQMQAQTAAE